MLYYTLYTHTYDTTTHTTYGTSLMAPCTLYYTHCTTTNAAQHTLYHTRYYTHCTTHPVLHTLYCAHDTAHNTVLLHTLHYTHGITNTVLLHTLYTTHTLQGARFQRRTAAADARTRVRECGILRTRYVIKLNTFIKC